MGVPKYRCFLMFGYVKINFNFSSRFWKMLGLCEGEAHYFLSQNMPYFPYNSLLPVPYPTDISTSFKSSLNGQELNSFLLLALQAFASIEELLRKMPTFQVNFFKNHFFNVRT